MITLNASDQLTGLDVPEIEVPDTVWKNTDLHEKARWLWCYLWAHPEQREYSYRELRETLGHIQGILLKYCDQLAALGWLRWERVDPDGIRCEAIRPDGGPCIRLPLNLVDERRLKPAQKWMWGLIRRLNGTFSYETLLQEGPWKYVDRLHLLLVWLANEGWLLGNDDENHSRKHVYKRMAINPAIQQRDAELWRVRQGLEEARAESDDAMARYLLANMVLAVTDGCMVLRHASPSGFIFLQTGERLYFDVYLPRHKVAVDLHRPEDDAPPEATNLTEEERWGRYVSVYRLGLSTKLGIQLLRIPTSELKVDRVRQLLEGKVPLKSDLRAVASICAALDEMAETLTS